MKYYLAQIDPIVGDIDGNILKITHHIKLAKKEFCNIIVFPELAICGYPPDDLLDYPFFVNQCIEAVDTLKKLATDITIIVGGVSKNKNPYGRQLYNSAFVLQNEKILKTIHKTLLPTYDIFTEKRYFEPNTSFEVIAINGEKVAISICEDLWDSHNKFNYKQNPINELTALKPTMHVNICASPFHQNKYSERNTVIQDCIKRMQCPLIYLNQSAAHTGILFDGDSAVYSKSGSKLIEFSIFKEEAKIFDTSLNYEQITPMRANGDIGIVYQALVFGIKSYFEKMGFKKTAVLGSSGGIDSALVQVLASEALGAENVLAVLMPSDFSSEGSIIDAKKLSENLGNPYEILPISNSFDTLTNTLSPFLKGHPFSIAEENIQARIRGLLLMAISNKTGRFLLNTSNKSEMAVGYTTLYGDMCGGLCPIGDIYKTQAYALCQYINKYEEKIPETIINKAPSAELRPNQKDSDSLPDYPLLDSILKLFIEGQLGKNEIIEKGCDALTVNKIVDLVNRNEYKRWQAAPVLKVTTKDFSYGRKMPLVAKYD